MASPATAPANIHAEIQIVVVGAGGAGFAAAITAAEAGANVLLLEQLDGPNGTTSRAVGSFAAAQTRLQKRSGVADDPADFAEDMAKAHELAPGEPALRAMYARESGAVVDWLEDMGMAFVGPYPEPPNRVPRMHNAIPNGGAYIQAMRARADALSVPVIYAAAADQIIMEEGRAVGVRYQHKGEHKTVRADAVIMAAGDFSASKELRAQFVPPAAAAALPINPASQGSGHRMVMAVGAKMKRMEMLFGPQLRFNAPPKESWINRLPRWKWFLKLSSVVVAVAPRWAIGPIVRELLIAHMSPVSAMFEAGAHLVDTTGKDLGARAAAVNELALSPGCAGYIIGPQTVADQFNKFPNYISTAPGIAFAYFKDYESGRPDLVNRAGTLENLAVALSINPKRLAEQLPAMAGRPVFALGPVLAMLTVTEGGAAIDTECRVLGADGAAIPGLYAAGGNGQGGLVLRGHGLHIGWAITSGRVAGRAAAAFAK